MEVGYKTHEVAGPLPVLLLQSMEYLGRSVAWPRHPNCDMNPSAVAARFLSPLVLASVMI